MALAADTRLGRYRIRSPIGAGGMGEVYLAHDTQLDRTVVLKILPAEFAASQQRMQRFTQEARAASALNHPNIIIIFEVGKEGATRFIVTEFIDGATLREHMRSAPLKMTEVLDIAVQVASALSAAHEAGVVHRDIKPENIMLRRDRLIKVLDFGLAKLTERQPASLDTDVATMAQVNTEPGMVMGTVHYMSPEQARGLSVDARTDIWSLGVVIYEMVARRTPFEGATSSHVIVSILENEPPPLSSLSPAVPAELERIVRKSLRKEREERYHTINDMIVDLRSLKQDLELQAHQKRAAQADTVVEVALAKGVTPSSNASSVITPVTEPTDARATAESAVKFTNRTRRRAALFALGALLLLALTLSFLYFFYFSKNVKTIDSIAVLPFVNASADPNAEYLSDGITESLINSLSQLPNLKVMSRNSVFRYKGRETDAQSAARSLGVRAVLTGRLVQQGDNLLISVELVDVSDNTHIWGEQYNRKLSSILAVQEEITRQISEKLRLKLTGEDKKQLTKRHTENVEAYQLYLRGLYHWNKWDEENLNKSLEYFEKAIQTDPAYALAYAGMSHAYGVLGFYGYRRPKDALPKAKAAALKAIEMDDSIAEAHAALGAIHTLYDWDWAAAERECQRSLELNPKLADTRHIYSMYLQVVSRFDEGIEQMKKAQELDPLSLLIGWNVGDAFYAARRYDEAIEQYRKALELDPDFAVAHGTLGLSYVHKGMYKEGIAELQKSLALSGKTAQGLAWLAYGYGASGNRAGAQKALDDLKDLSKQRYVSPDYMAMAYTGLGERDQAFEWLHKAVDERSNTVAFLKAEPIYDSLRSDPRYAEVARRIGLP
jgi:serine/threonine protein kinase/tetratricopeptide (TPR) repeat protein